MPIGKWMDQDVVYIHNGILLRHKKDKIKTSAATWMETLILSEMSERERQIPYNITYLWNLKQGTKDRIYKTETGRNQGQGEQTCGCQGRGSGMDGESGGGSGMDREFGVGGCKLLAWSGWAVRPYGTAQKTVWLGHFAVQQKWKRHYKSTIL